MDARYLNDEEADSLKKALLNFALRCLSGSNNVSNSEWAMLPEVLQTLLALSV